MKVKTKERKKFKHNEISSVYKTMIKNHQNKKRIERWKK